MTHENLIDNWNTSKPHNRVVLINSIIEKNTLPQKYIDLKFIDVEFDSLPQGFKSWLVDNLVETD